MSIRKKIMRSFLATLTVFGMAGFASADPIATVLAVRGTATTSAGAVEAGARFDEGTVIRTDGNSQLELEFDDGTLLAIGPNSELEISAVLMNGSNTASRFAVNTVGGTFRFITGESNKDVYEITTPTATIGIRGTEFDFYSSGETTGVTLYGGTVRLCLLDGSGCWEYRGSCAVALAEASRGRVRGLRQAEALSELNANFPYAFSQARLLEQFHVSRNACNKYLPDHEDDEPMMYYELIGECYDGGINYCSY